MVVGANLGGSRRSRKWSEEFSNGAHIYCVVESLDGPCRQALQEVQVDSTNLPDLTVGLAWRAGAFSRWRGPSGIPTSLQILRCKLQWERPSLIKSIVIAVCHVNNRMATSHRGRVPTCSIVEHASMCRDTHGLVTGFLLSADWQEVSVHTHGAWNPTPQQMQLKQSDKAWHRPAFLHLFFGAQSSGKRRRNPQTKKERRRRQNEARQQRQKAQGSAASSSRAAHAALAEDPTSEEDDLELGACWRTHDPNTASELRRRERAIVASEAQRAEEPPQAQCWTWAKKLEPHRHSTRKKLQLHGMEVMPTTANPHGPPKRPMLKDGTAHGGGEHGSGTRSSGNKDMPIGALGALMSMSRVTACKTGGRTLTCDTAGGSADNTCSV